MYPPPAGPELTEEQARQLDDTFLSSNPFEYFRSRIASLVSWNESANVERRRQSPGNDEGIRGELHRYLQQDVADRPFVEMDVDSQVAADAFALRHHAAEAVLRFAWACLLEPSDQALSCVWERVVRSPTQIGVVVKDLAEDVETAEGRERFFRSVIIPSDAERGRSDPKIVDAANVFSEWVSYAAQLVQEAAIDLQRAHNKVKHGFAVRARSDLLMTFTLQGPREDGTMPRSALVGDQSANIFDKPVLEYLAEAPKADGHRQGLEVTQIRLNTAALLADSYMLATTHAAMFHVAATRHFAKRESLPGHLRAPGHPGYPVGGPRPVHIDSKAPLGMRFPLTSPPGGGAVTREAGLGFRDEFIGLNVEYENHTQAVVTDE